MREGTVWAEAESKVQRPTAIIKSTIAAKMSKVRKRRPGVRFEQELTEGTGEEVGGPGENWFIWVIAESYFVARCSRRRRRASKSSSRALRRRISVSFSSSFFSSF